MCWGRFDGAIWFACFICLLACFSLLHFLWLFFLPCLFAMQHQSVNTAYIYIHFFFSPEFDSEHISCFSISSYTNTPPCSSLPPFLPLSLSFSLPFFLFPLSFVPSLFPSRASRLESGLVWSRALYLHLHLYPYPTIPFIRSYAARIPDHMGAPPCTCLLSIYLSL